MSKPRTIMPRIYQTLWHPNDSDNYYDHNHSHPHAPWLPHGNTRHDTVPSHMQDIHDLHIAKHKRIHVTDGTTNLMLYPKVTAIRVLMGATDDEPMSIIVNVAWFNKDGVCHHGIQESYRVTPDHDHHQAHVAHKRAVEATIPVKL